MIIISTYEQSKTEEIQYLNNTLTFIQSELDKDLDAIKDRRINLIASRKEMWENGPKSADDFDRIPELNNYLAEVNYQTQNYERIAERIKKYTSMLDTPYFGRLDFKEDGYDDIEKIYIGLHNLMDMSDISILVYDWRSPIASMYYQCDIGRGSYTSPVGVLSGDLSLKRQYNIEKGKLKYFFDSSVQIKDEILQQVLSKNTSPKMRHIVETIQKEQDLIIRDTSSQLLIVQGVAGSGKTSIALHRIAYLLYEGMNSNLFSNNIMIISPNSVFSDYISSVLPSLGEDNVEQTTLDDITLDILGDNLVIETRSQMLESLVRLHKHQDLSLRIKSLEFKNSLIFKKIIDRFVYYYIRRLIPFEDIYYGGKIIKTKEQLKAQLLNDKTSLPILKKLSRIENILIHNMEELKILRLRKIRKVVQKVSKHDFDLDEYTNYIANSEIKTRKMQIRKFTQKDYISLYKLFFKDIDLFLYLSRGLDLPNNISEIFKETKKELDYGYIGYEDAAGLLYLKLKFEGCQDFSSIKHLVIDEAQDYYPLQYEIFRLMFNHANFTVLGDFNQTLEKLEAESIYMDITGILNKAKSVTLSLNKGYRSSYEINLFSQKVIGNYDNDLTSFIRHGSSPLIIESECLDDMHKLIINDISILYKNGYDSIAIICKTDRESAKLRKKLEPYVTNDIKLLIIPAYMSKGLEFDAVLVYNVSKDNYSSLLDNKLLYIACTRALHELRLYYTQSKSTFLNFNI